jgi:hypothetical protein
VIREEMCLTKVDRRRVRGASPFANLGAGPFVTVAGYVVAAIGAYRAKSDPKRPW